MKKRILRIAAAAAIAVVLAGCAGTHLISSWVSPASVNSRLNGVMVISLMGGEYTAYQQSSEQIMSDKLTMAGVNAVSARQAFGPTPFKGMSEQQVLAAIKEAGCTQVMLISLLDKQQEVNYTPGYYSTNQFLAPGYGPFYNRYALVNERVYNPGYYTRTTEYLMQAQVFSLTAGVTMYDAYTGTLDPMSITKLIEEFSSTVIKDMHSKGLTGK